MSLELDHLTLEQVQTTLGGLLLDSLKRHGAAVFILRPDDMIFRADPRMLDGLPEADLVPFLLSWPDELLVEFLSRRSNDQAK